MVLETMSKTTLFLLLVHFAFQFTQAQHGFRNDYFYIQDTDTYYKFHTLAKTVNEAKIVCEREGAILFHPENESHVIAVTEYWKIIQKTIQWIVVNMMKSDIVTVEGISKSGVYSNWRTGEPNNAGGIEDCIVFNIDRTINDEKCNNPFPFVCMKANESIAWDELCRTPYPGYTFDSKQGKCYKYHVIPRNWFEAYAICHGEQAYLAVPDDDKEAAHLVDLISKSRKKDPWKAISETAIHLGFLNKDGWITIKGVPMHLNVYQKWGQSQPDGGIGEDCGAMAYDGLLRDITCSQKMNFICELEVASG